jgi:hypothetical protein
MVVVAKLTVYAVSRRFILAAGEAAQERQERQA